MDWEATRDPRPCLREFGLPAVVVVVVAKRCPLIDMPVEQRYPRDTDLPPEKQRYCLTRALVAVGPLLDSDQAELHRKSVVFVSIQTFIVRERLL